MPAREQIEQERVEIGGIETFVRRSPGEGAPTLFVHGNPTNSDEWLPFLERLEGPGVALDLPNFGRSGRPSRDRFDAGMHAYADFLGAAIDQLCPGELQLVVHDWGAIALQPMQRRAERLRRLVVINAVPLLAGYRWHWVGRIWRRRGLGELANAAITRSALALGLRQARPGFAPMPADFVESIWRYFDRDTRRAVLCLYRSADPGALEAAGAHLERLACPALVIWGRRDPYIGAEFGDDYAARLPQAALELVPEAGHWPWIDRPELLERTAAFLADGR